MDLRGGGHHLVGGLHHAAVHLLGALGADERGDLVDGIDVGRLEETLVERAEAGLAGGGHGRLAGSLGLEEQVGANRLPGPPG